MLSKYSNLVPKAFLTHEARRVQGWVAENCSWRWVTSLVQWEYFSLAKQGFPLVVQAPRHTPHIKQLSHEASTQETGWENPRKKEKGRLFCPACTSSFSRVLCVWILHLSSMCSSLPCYGGFLWMSTLLSKKKITIWRSLRHLTNQKTQTAQIRG